MFTQLGHKRKHKRPITHLDEDMQEEEEGHGDGDEQEGEDGAGEEGEEGGEEEECDGEGEETAERHQEEAHPSFQGAHCGAQLVRQLLQLPVEPHTILIVEDVVEEGGGELEGEPLGEFHQATVHLDS